MSYNYKLLSIDINIILKYKISYLYIIEKSIPIVFNSFKL